MNSDLLTIKKTTFIKIFIIYYYATKKREKRKIGKRKFSTFKKKKHNPKTTKNSRNIREVFPSTPRCQKSKKKFGRQRLDPLYILNKYASKDTDLYNDKTCHRPLDSFFFSVKYYFGTIVIQIIVHIIKTFYHANYHKLNLKTKNIISPYS